MSQAGTYNAGTPPPGTVVISLSDDAGTKTFPDGTGDIGILGGAGIDTTAGASEITITLDGSVATTYVTDSGNAVPAGGTLNVLGTHGINTSGAGNTVTIAINNAITLGDLSNLGGAANALTIATGGLLIRADNGVGNLKLPFTGNTSDLVGQITMDGLRWIHATGPSSAISDYRTNIFMGLEAGPLPSSGMTGRRNTGVGFISSNSLTTGESNSCFGQQSGVNITTGSINCCIGTQAGALLTTGGANCFVGGQNAGQGISTGGRNIAIGNSTMKSGDWLGASSNNIQINTLSPTSPGGLRLDNVYIQNIGPGAETNTIRIGTQGSGDHQQNRCFIAGIATVSVPNTEMVTIDTTTGQLGSDTIPTGFATTFTTDSGDALPAAGVLNVLGGTNASTSGAGNTITIDVSGAGGFTWTVVTTAQTGINHNGYFTNDAGPVDVALPASAAVGDTFQVAAMSAGGWTISQGAGQQVRVGTSTTAVGITGSIESTAQGDWVTLVCSVADSEWMAFVNQGNPNVI